MSGHAVIRDLVQSVVDSVVNVLHGKDKEQDERMDRIEARVSTLEIGQPNAEPMVIDVPVKRGPGRPRKAQSVVAQASTVEGAGEAPDAGGVPNA